MMEQQQQLQGLSGLGVQEPQGEVESRESKVMQIVEMLMQGVPPEQLIQQGVSVELIKQAIATLEEQMVNQGQSISQDGGGLSQVGY